MTKSFTEEEVTELLKKTREIEQWRIAGDTYYRESNANMQTKVQQGIYDPYILQVGQALHNAFRQANTLNPPPTEKEPEPE